MCAVNEIIYFSVDLNSSAFVVTYKRSQIAENIFIMINLWASDMILRQKKIRKEREREIEKE